MRKLLAGFAFLAITTATADAGCVCRCVDGEMRALCSSSIDLEPICPPRICPMSTPSIAPLQMPRLAPLGTSSCRQAQVCNSFGQCRWQEVCR